MVIKETLVNTHMSLGNVKQLLAVSQTIISELQGKALEQNRQHFCSGLGRTKQLMEMAETDIGNLMKNMISLMDKESEDDNE